MSERQLELIQAGFDAYRQDGPLGLSEFMRRHDLVHPEFLVHVQEDLPNGGDWRGIEGYEEMTRVWLEAWDEFELEPHQFLSIAEGCYLVPLRQRARARGSGIEVEGEFFYVFLFDNGKIEQIRLYGDRTRAERAARRAANP